MGVSGNYDIDVELRAGSVLLSSAGLDDIPSFRAEWARISEETSRTSLDSVRVEDLLLDGETELLVRVYSPDGPSTGRPAVVLLHSGGYVGGSIETVHAECLELAESLGAVVVTVAYRLAPECPYPAALDDCVRAVRWVSRQHERLGVDPQRIALHGTSAGGGLAAATVLTLLGDPETEVAFLYLNSPQLDDRLETASMREFVDTPCFTRRSAEISWGCYLGPVTGSHASVPILAAPGRASVTDVRGFPATYVAAMQFDPLRDEAIAFAGTLLAAGVPVELHVFPQTFHGSSVIDHAEVSQRESGEAQTVLRGRLRATMW